MPTDSTDEPFFQSVTNTRFQFISYASRSTSLALQDLLAGRIDMQIVNPATSLPLVRGGQIKAFAVTAKTRIASAPDIPTVDEAGLVGFDFSTWNAFWAPSGCHAERHHCQAQCCQWLRHWPTPAVQSATSCKLDKRESIRAKPTDAGGARQRFTRPRSRSGGRSFRRRTSRANDPPLPRHEPSCVASERSCRRDLTQRAERPTNCNQFGLGSWRKLSNSHKKCTLLDKENAMVGTLAEILPHAARRHGSRTALIFGDRRFSFLELDELSNRVANGLDRLRRQSRRPGDALWPELLGVAGRLLRDRQDRRGRQSDQCHADIGRSALRHGGFRRARGGRVPGQRRTAARHERHRQPGGRRVVGRDRARRGQIVHGFSASRQPRLHGGQTGAWGSGGDLLHIRHDRASEGSHAEPSLGDRRGGRHRGDGRARTA